MHPAASKPIMGRGYAPRAKVSGDRRGPTTSIDNYPGGDNVSPHAVRVTNDPIPCIAENSMDAGADHYVGSASLGVVPQPLIESGAIEMPTCAHGVAYEIYIYRPITPPDGSIAMISSVALVPD
jgi:hypothetical protein